MGSSFDFATRKKEKFKEPDDYKVILLNDDWTSMEFVIYILMTVFNKNEEDAERTMLNVHNHGRGIAGVYIFDIAQTKAAQVHQLAAKNNFPLRCVLEKV
ncbi:MAG: ATP-dependent Clp protease adaptor ClpS [Spirochaetaceae bacterium]|nr:ATP-dependent Clp protease adaptor ClpS [Spirochaetaceae bacterium]